MKNTKPCRFNNRPGGCRFGATCKFSHDNDPQNLNGSAHRITDNGPSTRTLQREMSNSEVEFRTWRFMVPKDADYAPPLGSRLSKFFEKSSELVITDPGTRQDVISRLASAGGRLRIQELVDQDLSGITDGIKLQKFMSLHVPFFQALVNPDIFSSIILEQPVSKLITFLYGLNGQRAIKLFLLTAQILLDLPKQDI